MTELELVRIKIREHMNNMADDIAGGACQDFPEYQHHTGIIKGLALAEREILDLAEKLSKQEFED